MSLITRCPACETMFRVVPDQLRISEGWVRCGHCTEVFDAALHLQPQAFVPEPAPVPPPEPATLSADLPASAVQEAGIQTSPPPLASSAATGPEIPAVPAFASDFSPPPTSPPSFTPSFPAPELESVSPGALSSSPLAWGAAPSHEAAPHALADDAGTVERAMAEKRHEASAALTDAPVPEEVIAAPMTRESLPNDALPGVSPTAADAPAPEEPTESTIEDMSFVRDARRKAFWRRPGVRVGLVVAGVLLVAVLVLQIAVHERDRIAALDPRAKPWLEELCGPLQCTVKPLRQIESIVIESSAFNKVRGNAYRFSISLRNKSSVPLAMPGIELALTDSQDQPMLRRVLLPADLGAAAVIAPGAEWSTSLPVSVAPTTQTARIAGYRLLAFYP